MGAQSNAAPVIIKRNKVVGGGGHHGGAWKVAYADFVTAMMAFFMLMWLLNATTEQQRKGIADYFSPTIPINRISGGGDGAFGGDSIFSENTLAKNGTGATAKHHANEDQARGDTGGAADAARAAEDAALKAIESELMGRGGESLVMENVMRHVITRLTDEGLVIEVFEMPQTPLFEDGSDRPTQLLRDLVAVITESTKMVINEIAVGAHVSADPVVLVNSPVWELSARRATRMRLLMQDRGVAPRRIQRVTGHADREPAVRDPMARRNNRLEVVLLRETP
ncbi:flagellar motor protein MotB [Sulfitobacter aestuarii]|uniref:Flagellar motor protein MotB n=1 Tax=Sulfitobacter aestuarii TaxID=2161676 RepID=A0ABW5U6H9_9RHOB